MASTGFAVTIRMVDQSTGVLNRVNTGLENFYRRVGVTQTSVNRFNQALGKFGNNTGISRLADDVGGLGQKITSAAAGLGRFAPALGALTSAASVAGLARMIENWTAFGSRLGFDSQRIGVTAQNLHGLQGAARLAGSSAEALTSGMTSLQDGLTNAAAGRDPQMVQTLASLGIALFDTTGHARRAEQVLPQLADRIAGITDPSVQALAATRALGAAGESLLPLFRRGAAGMADYNAQAARYGLFNELGVAGANAMREAQTRLGLAVEGVGYAISEKVAPVLVPMLLRFSDWIAGHREDIGRFLASVAEGMQRWIETQGIDRFLKRMGNVGDALKKTVEVVQGLGTALRTAFDFSLDKIERLHRLIQSARETLGLSNESGPSPIPDPQAGLLNGRLVNSLPPHIQQLLRQPGRGPDGATPSERTHAGLLIGRPGGRSTTGEEQWARAQQARDILVGLGWSRPQAAGIVANLQEESRFDPNAVGDNGAAFGLAQWHPDRRAALEAGTGRRVLGSSFEDQVRFVDWELRNTESGAGNRLAGARTAGEAGGIVSQYYERPAARDAEAANRASVAQAWEERWRMSVPQRAAVAPVVAPIPPLAAPVPLLSAPSPAAGAAGASGENGKVLVRIEHANPPPGSRVTTVSSGSGLRVETPTLGNVP